MTQLRSITATSADGGWTLVTDGGEGRVRDGRFELGADTFTLAPAGARWVLCTGKGDPAVRFDPAGRKATWLATASGRHRLARLRSRPLQHRWQLTHDVRSEPVFTVSHTPLGHRLRVVDAAGIPADELVPLALATLASVLGMVDTAVAA